MSDEIGTGTQLEMRITFGGKASARGTRSVVQQRGWLGLSCGEAPGATGQTGEAAGSGVGAAQGITGQSGAAAEPEDGTAGGTASGSTGLLGKGSEGRFGTSPLARTAAA